MEGTRIINKFGTMQGWNSVTANFLGRDAEGITEISYDDEVTKENVKGAGMMPIGRAVTGYEANASITLMKEEVDALMRSLPKGKRLQDISPFDINVVYINQDFVVQIDRIRNCEFTNVGVAVKQGDGTIATEYKLIVSHIEWNIAS